MSPSSPCIPVRTEGVLRAAEYFDLSNSKSPQFIGRAFAACATGLTGQAVPSPRAWFRFGNPAAVTSQAVLTLNVLTLSTECDLVQPPTF